VVDLTSERYVRRPRPILLEICSVKKTYRHWAAAALLVATGSAACGGAPPPVPVQPTAGLSQAGAGRTANPADVEFMSGMIHHHAQALVMSELASMNSANPSVRILSERIMVSQTDEIKMMQQWLAEMGEPVPEASPTGMRMVMGGVEHDMLMPGMLTEQQVAELRQARGADFDRLFLRYMIQHHEGALVMVEKLFAAYGGGLDDFIYKMASDTFADQGSEIDRMQRMLDAMAGPSGP